MVADEDGPEILPPAVRAQGRLQDRALGKAADGFGTAIAPLGQEVGAVTVRTVRLALRGLSAVTSGAERIYEWMEAAVIDRLKDIPENELAPPSARIALPALQGAVFASEEQEAPIREMFANLIAKDMTKQGKLDVHPSFVEIVKQLSTDDAKFLQYFPQHGPQMLAEITLRKKGERGYAVIGHYVTASIGIGIERTIISVYSLARLGIVEIYESKWPVRPEFNELERAYLELPEVQKHVDDTTDALKVRKSGIYLTPIGQAFVKACLGAGPTPAPATAETLRARLLG